MLMRSITCRTEWTLSIQLTRKTVKQKGVMKCGLDSVGSAQRPEAGCYEHGNKLPVSWKTLPVDRLTSLFVVIVMTSGSWPLGVVLNNVVVLPVDLMKAGTTQYPPPTAKVQKKKTCHISLSSYATTEAHLTYDIDFTSNIHPPPNQRVLLY